jgi:uncharacterized membrane protein YphA (DoxX/SURF4 family)
MNILIGWLLIGVAIALFLTGLWASLRRGSDAPPRPATCFMLILLRLAIGWHFFIEGMEKLHNPAWTSAGYLREATGPLAPKFRELAGDPVIDMLSVRDENTLPPALEQDWQNYVDAVVEFYNLNSVQAGKVRDAVEALKKPTAQMLTAKKKPIENDKIPAYPPSLRVPMTFKERIAKLGELQAEVLTIEKGPLPDAGKNSMAKTSHVEKMEDWKNLPHYTSEAFEPWKTAKGNANRWRGELQKDLALINREMKRTVRDALLDILADKMPETSRKKVDPAIKNLRKLSDTEINGAYAKVFDKIKLQPGHTYVIDMASPEIDCYLRLEDGSGIKLAEDLGSGRKAQIKYKVADTKPPEKEVDPKIAIPDTYRIVAGSFNKAVGSFTITCMDQAADIGMKKTAKRSEDSAKKEQRGAARLGLTSELMWLSTPMSMSAGPFPLLLTSWEFYRNALDVEAFELALQKDSGDKKQPEKKAADAFKIGTPFKSKITDKDEDPTRKWTSPDDWEAIDKIKDKLEEKIAEEYRKAIDSSANDHLTSTLIIDNILAKRKKDQPPLDPLPFPVVKPWRQWSLLDWSDQIVKYGVVGVGALLLVGLFTRLACVAGAGFLLMFFLAMPPLPGWPESPKAEGHYLYVNKNIIEMLALLVLATTYSGRWLGLDGFVQFLNPWRWRRRPIEGNMLGSPMR